MKEKLGYSSADLTGIFKLSSSRLPYPIDVLLSYAPPIDLMLGTFDFNLCKTGMSLLKDGLKDERAIAQSEYGVSLFMDNGFIRDIENKTLTISNNRMDVDEFVRSIERHYPKMKKKFPDYQLTLGEVSPEIERSVMSLCESVYLKENSTKLISLNKKFSI